MGRRWESWEHYDCAALCFAGNGEHVEQRAEFRCGLPDFPRARWGPVFWSTRHMGRLPVYREEPGDAPCPADRWNPSEPPESHEDGCPGSWYRTPFVMSLSRYMRPLSGGSFQSNPILDRCEDSLVLDLIRYFEAEVIRARAHDERQLAGKE